MKRHPMLSRTPFFLSWILVFAAIAAHPAYAATAIDHSTPLPTIIEEATNGNSIAKYLLGYKYFYGEDVLEDKKKGVKHLKESAHMGFVNAQTLLAAAYFAGAGTKQNFKECLRWANAAAKTGDSNAQMILSECYRLGAGVEQDNYLADHWRFKAAQQNDEMALKKILAEKNEIDTEYYAPRLERDAKKGNYIAQYQLGLRLMSGKGIEKNPKAAFENFTKSANNNYEPAQRMLVVCYTAGVGTEINFHKVKEIGDKIKAARDNTLVSCATSETTKPQIISESDCYRYALIHDAKESFFNMPYDTEANEEKMAIYRERSKRITAYATLIAANTNTPTDMAKKILLSFEKVMSAEESKKAHELADLVSKNIARASETSKTKEQ